MSGILRYLETTSARPEDSGKFNAWIGSEDVDALMAAHEDSDVVILYASLLHAFLHTILVPARLLNPPDVEDLMSWNCNARSSWGVTCSFADPPKAYLSPPLDHTGSKTLDQGEQLVFKTQVPVSQ